MPVDALEPIIILHRPVALPDPKPDWDIAASPFLPELKREYGNGISYERAKIKYLLGHTSLSKYQFVRMDYVYNGERTAQHLRKKYRQRFDEIVTAQDFIDDIASISTGWRRPYLALPGDGLAYSTGDILSYELSRLEAFIDEEMGSSLK